MKTNSVTELLKAKGIGVTPDKQPAPSPLINSQPVQKRKRLYESPEASILSSDSLQRVSRESLENSTKESREATTDRDFSRESPVVNQDSLQRVSRESLEKKCVDLTRIVGLQRQVLFIVFSVLQSNGVRVSPPIAISLIAEKANTTIANTQNAIKELIKKGVLIRKDFQRGRGGWTIYELEEAIYSKLDSEKTRESLENLQRFSSRQMGAKFRETPPSSSSVLNIKNITTTELVDLEWQKIDLGQSDGLGLSRYHVTRSRELYPNLDPVSVQKLIYGFERHLSLPENKKAIRNPGAFFLSLAEKLSKVESPLPEYKNPDDDLIEKLQAVAAAKLKKYQERLNTLQLTVFENWWCETKDAEKSNLVASSSIKGETYKLAVRARWVAEVWPGTPEAQSLNEVLIDA